MDEKHLCYKIFLEIIKKFPNRIYFDVKRYITLNDTYVKRIYYKGEKTFYFVSRYGDVINAKDDSNIKFVSKFDSQTGYPLVTLSINKHPKTTSVHRLVAKAFIKEIKGKPDVNHIDGDKKNSCDWNLEWCTKRENAVHAVEHNLIDIKSRERITSDVIFNIACDIEDGSESLNNISKKYNVSFVTVSNILNGKSHKYLQKKFDFSNRDNHRSRETIPRETIIAICKDLQDTDLSYPEIGRKYNVSPVTVGHILTGRVNIWASKDFDFSKRLEKSPTYGSFSADTIRKVCELFVENEKTPIEIESITGVPRNYVLDILHGKKRKSISKEYDFSHYDKKIQRKEHDEELHKKIEDLLLKGYRNCDIQRMLNLPQTKKYKSLVNNRKNALRKLGKIK